MGDLIDDEFELAPVGQVIRWFTDSPDAGDPACLCSLCGKPIPEDEIPWRVTKMEENHEARFHEACAPLVDPRHFAGDEPHLPEGEV